MEKRSLKEGKLLLLVFLALALLLCSGSSSYAAFKFNFVPFLTKQSVYSANGAVTTHSPMASEVGIEILKKGGNAFDAGIAVALALTAVDPTMCSPAGSSFYLCYDVKSKKVQALDADNLAPYAATPDKFTRETLGEGVMSMGIPGNLAGYFAILERYGTMSFGEVAQPAIRYLEDGFVMTPLGSLYNSLFCAHCPAVFPNLARVYAPDGSFPQPGELMKNPDLARTYRKIAGQGKDVFYKGEIAKEMVDYVQAQGGLWTMKDLADYEVQWKEPLHMTYKGYDVYGCPPPSSALTWMEILKILEGYDLQAMGYNSLEYIHTIVEAEKLAHADAYQFVADPDFVDVPAKELLSDNYAKAQRKRIDPKKAAQGRVRYGKPREWAANPDAAKFEPPLPSLEVSVARTEEGTPLHGCTTHVSVTDSWGNCFTFTHTIGNIFGGHDVLGNTGVLGSNSMDWFDLDKNVWSGEKSNLIVEPRKRNRFTLCPGMVFKDGKPYILVGGSAAETTMPGVYQMLLNMLEFNMGPQEAISAPRECYGDVLHHTGGTRLGLDAEIRDAIGKDLKAMGHDVVPGEEMYRPLVGMIDAIMIDPETGHFASGAEVRTDGQAAGY
ncbi:MAG: gamma-glutamyltransferase [Deltaproteobacteria bacterium]|nr:gamma-glutamyltransferase [Deltaproteobacteria bacterium]